MAVTNTIDLLSSATRIQRWLSKQFPAAHDIVVSNVEIPAASGLSNQTILFVVELSEGAQRIRRDLVARVQPTGSGVFPSYDVGLEAKVMTSLARSTDVPIPNVVFYEEDPEVLGAPFLVMDRLPGAVPADNPPFTVSGWLIELTDSERAVLYDNGLRALAAVHSVDWRELELAALAGARDPLDDQFDLYRKYYDWAAEGERNPTIDAAFERLREIQPVPTGERVLCWGDARLGNLLYQSDQSVAGILDWEMVTTGPPGMDLGWWLFTLRHHTEGIGVPLPAGFLAHDATVARYEELSGRQISDLTFYEAFAGLRLSLMMVRVAHLLIRAGNLPSDSQMATNNPSLQLLAKLLDLQPPQGVSATFIGNR